MLVNVSIPSFVNERVIANGQDFISDHESAIRKISSVNSYIKVIVIASIESILSIYPIKKLSLDIFNIDYYILIWLISIWIISSKSINLLIFSLVEA